MLKVLGVMALWAVLGGAVVADAKENDNFTIVITRHAEKVADKPDPELSEQGQQRAHNLAKLLRYVALQKIYATKYQRTQQTALPAAAQRGMSVSTYAAGESDALIREVLEQQQSVLIVGHSNTVPELVTAAGGKAVELTEQDYGDVFVLQVMAGQVMTTRLYVNADGTLVSPHN